MSKGDKSFVDLKGETYNETTEKSTNLTNLIRRYLASWTPGRNKRCRDKYNIMIETGPEV